MQAKRVTSFKMNYFFSFNKNEPNWLLAIYMGLLKVTEEIMSIDYDIQSHLRIYA